MIQHKKQIERTFLAKNHLKFKSSTDAARYAQRLEEVIWERKGTRNRRGPPATRCLYIAKKLRGGHNSVGVNIRCITLPPKEVP